MGGDSFRQAMVDRADVQPGQRVLDIGCGTGNLVAQLLTLQPGAEVVGRRRSLFGPVAHYSAQA